MRLLPFAVAAVAVIAAGPALADTQPGPLAPRDECAGDAGLAALGEKLRLATRSRDADALLALVDADIKLDFGDGSGKAELRRRLSSARYALWQELDAALALGCGLSAGQDSETYASWPWYFSKDIIPIDPFEAHIVTGENVRLRSGPSRSAPVIGSVSWDYVRLTDYPPETAAYAKAETRTGTLGYIAKSYLRSLVDYRLVADKIDGTWRITAFVAGD